MYSKLADIEEKLQVPEEEVDYPDDREYYNYKPISDYSQLHEMFTSLYEDSKSD